MKRFLAWSLSLTMLIGLSGTAWAAGDISLSSSSAASDVYKRQSLLRGVKTPPTSGVW